MKRLTILLLEDNPADAELIEHHLKAAGLEFRLTRIQSEDELQHALERSNPDLVLSDHGLPSFDGFRALELVRASNPSLPFIFVSGSNNRGMVARMYEEGASDYVFKKDLHDLPDAVQGVLKPAVLPDSENTAPLSACSSVAPTLTRVWLCPFCLRLRDEKSAIIELRQYLANHSKVLVFRERCSDCQ